MRYILYICFAFLLFNCTGHTPSPSLPATVPKPVFDSLKDLEIEHLPTDSQKKIAISDLERRYPTYLHTSSIRNASKLRSTFSRAFGHFELWSCYTGICSPEKLFMIVTRGSLFCYAFPVPDLINRQYKESFEGQIFQNELNILFKRLCSKHGIGDYQHYLFEMDTTSLMVALTDQIFETLHSLKIESAEVNKVLERFNEQRRAKNSDPDCWKHKAKRIINIVNNLKKEGFLLYSARFESRDHTYENVYYQIQLPKSRRDSFKVSAINLNCLFSHSLTTCF